MHRSFPQLVASICLLAVWIATPILSVAHLVLEEHSYCAEHEGLEEGSHRESQAESDTLASDLVFNQPNLPREKEGEHEECAFGEEFTRECLLATLSDHIGTTPPMFARVPSLPGPLAEATADLLQLAPKTSPPSAS